MGAKVVDFDVAWTAHPEIIAIAGLSSTYEAVTGNLQPIWTALDGHPWSGFSWALNDQRVHAASSSAFSVPVTFGGSTGPVQMPDYSAKIPQQIHKYADSFFTDFYYRLWVNPKTVDFGAFTSNTTVSFDVWNAFPNTNSITSFSNLPDGVTAGATFPLDIGSLNTVTIPVTASTEGEATFDQQAVLVFAQGTAVRVQMTGVRAVVWPFAANWRNNIEVTYTYKTDIISSRSGREQRRALRRTPRRNFMWTVTAFRDTSAALKRVINSSQDKKIFWADETEPCTLVSDSSDNIVTLDRAPTWYPVNRSVIVQDAAGNRTVRAVLGVSGKTLTLKPSTVTFLPAGTTIFPALIGYMNQKVTLRAVSDNTLEGQVSVEIDPGSEQVLPISATPKWTFDNIPVFAFRPNWKTAPEIEFTRDVQFVDFERGRRAIFRPVSYTQEARKMNFTAFSKAQVQELLDEFLRAKGRARSIWVPSLENDVLPAQASPLNSATITVAGKGFYDAYATDATKRAICIELLDGSFQFNVITSITYNGANSIVNLRDPLQTEVSTLTVSRVSFMHLARFASDEVTLSWETDSVASMTLTLISLEDTHV